MILRRQRRMQLLAAAVATATTTITTTTCAFADSSPPATAPAPAPSPLIGLCQGGCQIHDDCQSGLVCYKRNGDDPAIAVGEDAPGCNSRPESDGDEIQVPVHDDVQDGTSYCISPSQNNFTHLTYIGQRGPMGTCAGDCDTDDDCIHGLLCYQRKDRPYDIPYKCRGNPWGSVDYCVEPPPDDEYVRGFLTSTKYGVKLSNGLDIRPIAQSGQPVLYANGTSSRLPFHHLPDYGACFEDTTGRNPGGWAYVSNSEVKNGGGGAGVILFNKDGRAMSYDMLLKNTSRNCGGGVTSWQTFISCEESGNTHCHELDPLGGGLVNKEESRTALGGAEGGNFESFAYDERDSKNPSYFISAQDDFQTALGMKMVRHASINEIGLSYAKVMKEDGYLEYFHTSKGEKLSDAIENNDNVKEAFAAVSKVCLPIDMSALKNRHNPILSSYKHINLHHSFEYALDRLSKQCHHWCKAEKLDFDEIISEFDGVCSNCNLTSNEFVKKGCVKRNFKNHLKYCKKHKRSCDSRGLPFRRAWKKRECIVDGCTTNHQAKCEHMCQKHFKMPTLT